MTNVISLQPVRRYARVECDSQVRVACGGREIEATCRNLSLGGLWVDLAAFSLGSTVEVTLRLDGALVHARASVRRLTPDGMGLQLHWLEPLDLVRLHRFVAHRLVGLEAA